MSAPEKGVCCQYHHSNDGSGLCFCCAACPDTAPPAGQTSGRLLTGADLDNGVTPRLGGAWLAGNRSRGQGDDISIRTIQELAARALNRRNARDHAAADEIEAGWDAADRRAIAGAVDPDDLVLTEVLQAAGEPVGVHAAYAPLPAQRPVGIRPPHTSPLFAQQRTLDRDQALHAAFLATTRAALADLLRPDGFTSTHHNGCPVIEHPSGVRVRVSTSGIYVTYDDVVAASLEDTTAGALPSTVRRVLQLSLSNPVHAVAAAAAGLAAICGDPRTVPVAGRVGRDQVDEVMDLVWQYGNAAAALGILTFSRRDDHDGLARAEAVADMAKRVVQDRLNQLLFPTPDGTLGR